MQQTKWKIAQITLLFEISSGQVNNFSLNLTTPTRRPRREHIVYIILQNRLQKMHILPSGASNRLERPSRDCTIGFKHQVLQSYGICPYTFPLNKPATPLSLHCP